MQSPEPFRALNSASNLYRRKLCPGSAQAEEGLPELAELAASAHGTAMHRIEQAGGESEIITGNVWEKRALEKNQRLSEQFITATLSHLGITDPGERIVFKEREFFLNDTDGEPLWPPIPGHTDEVVLFPMHGIVFVFDSKFGRYPVTKADQNLQLRCYAVMVHDDVGGHDFYTAIRQPYLREPDDFHAAQYLAGDIIAARAELLAIIAATQAPDAPRIPSPDACTFCRARGTPRCPESLTFIEDIRRAQVCHLKPDKLEAMGHAVMTAAGIADAWMQRIRFIAESYPQLLKIYELAPEQLMRTVENPAAALAALRPDLVKWSLGSPEADAVFGEVTEFMNGCCDVSLPRMKTWLAAKLQTTEEAAEKMIFELASAYITSKPKARSIRRKK